jgi:hypothetical protein
VAPYTGPFPHRPFLELCAQRSGSPSVVLAGAHASAALTIDNDVIRFVGEHHLTDYHSPLGSGVPELVGLMSDLDPALPFDLDSLPVEAADPLEAAFRDTGYRVNREDDEGCQVLDLQHAPADGWEGQLSSKGRHELRRKRRRFVEAVGEPLVAHGADYFEEFVALHRASAGEKGTFMTEDMEAFFHELLVQGGARIDVLHDGTSVLAAAFGFDDDSGYYLYNSAFDPSLADVSPGIVLIDALIADAVARGLDRFDFLKGDEVYKRRLGADPRPLFRLKVTR